MNKYLRDKTVCDFLVAPNSYFNHANLASTGVTQDAIDTVRDQGGIKGEG